MLSHLWRKAIVVEEPLPDAGGPGGSRAAKVQAEHLEAGGGEDVSQGMRGVEVEVDVVGGETVTEEHRLDEAADRRAAVVNGEERSVGALHPFQLRTWAPQAVVGPDGDEVGREADEQQGDRDEGPSQVHGARVPRPGGQGLARGPSVAGAGDR